MSEVPLLIAGLGNPGQSYARNRHNVGFMAVDVIHESYEFGPWRRRFEGVVSEGTLARRKTVLLKPATYMNESGRSVGAAARFFKLPPESIVVMHDEIDLAAAKLRMKAGGGDAGHNGLRSITSVLGPAYRRVRIGVGHPGEKERVHGHVLQNFSGADEEWLGAVVSARARGGPFLARAGAAGFRNPAAAPLSPPAQTPPTPKTEKSTH